MRVTFDWDVSPLFGWGVYGLNLALEWAGDRDIEARTSGAIKLDGVDALRRRCLADFARRSLAGRGEDLRLCALGNDLVGNGGRVGVAFFEQPLSAAAVERAKWFDLIITGSSWNEQLLRDRGVESVKTILQGVDPTLFHPAPRRGLFRDRFVIFSGGKAEPRKGQDLVVKTFRIFAKKHPEALLVTAWHSPWPGLRAGMDLDLSDLADQVIDVGQVPNALMPGIYRECDVGLFPNRLEGGTNLVAMECMACGVLPLLSGGTGHEDLLKIGGQRITFAEQAVANPHDIIDVLEFVMSAPSAARSSALKGAEAIAAFTWARTASELKGAIAPFVNQQGVAA